MRASRIIPFLVILTGCGVEERAPEGPSMRVYEETLGLGRAPVEVVLIVDDASTPEAQALRAAVPSAVRGMLRAERGERFDPARQVRIDWEMTVVWPSALGSARWVTAESKPGLRIERLPLDDAALESAISGLAEVVSAPPSAPSAQAPYAPYAPLRALAERLAVPSGRFRSVVVASTRDDEGSGPVSVPRSSGLDLALVDATGVCEGAPFPRLASIAATSMGIGCPDLAARGPFSVFADVVPRCRPRPMVDDEGPRCFVEVESELPCNATQGWSRAEDWGGTPGRCRVAPLGGDARVRCETTAACAGCGHGFCIPREAEPGCSHPWVRLVGDAAYGARVVRTVCAVER